MKCFYNLCAVALLFLSNNAQAADLRSPLPVRNFDAPMMRFFDPTPDSALRSYDAYLSFELNQHYATVNSFDRLPNAQLLVDMELYVVDPVLRYALSPRLEISLRTPVLRPTNGMFDALIQDFHRVFDMPNGGRELRPNNSYAYVLRHDQGAQWQSASRWEFGNVELSGRYQLAGSKDWAIAALAAVKLPTASKTRGWGSGAIDLAGGLVLSIQQGDWFGHVEGWLTHPLAKDDPGLHYKQVYSRGSLTAGYQLCGSAAVTVQAQGGTSPYRSGISNLDHPPFLISFGLRGLSSQGWGWSVAVVENISQVTTQDISITASLSWSMS